MKRIIVTAISLLLLLIPLGAIAGVIQPARLKYLEGDVQYRMPATEDWLPATVNTPLDEGDTLWCPEGARAEVQLPDGSIVRLDGGSHLNILANEEKFIHLNLAKGRIYVKTSPASSTDSLQIDADDTTVLPAERTRLRIDMLETGEEDVSIFKGSAYVEGNGNRTKVRAGEQIALEEGHNELLSLNPPDDWESWNLDRDRIFAAYGRSGSHLPEELRSYEGELELNGSWAMTPDYGMVWRPNVMITDEWVPYRNGRWGWRGDDYVWISFENWGWVPYHFGRWTVVGNLGWCWVPPERGDAYWGPGYVGWYRDGDYVGWTPLAPRETFYGYGYYGRYSVNIRQTRVNTTVVDYRNRHQRGGVTVVRRNDFLSVGARRLQPVPSASVSVAVGSPRTRPVRETSMPVAGPPRGVPPRAGFRDSRELRQRYPRVITRGQEGSGNARHAEPVVQPSQPPTAVPGTATQPRRQLQQGSQPAADKQSVIRPSGKPQPAPAPNATTQKRIWRVRTPDVVKEREPKAQEQRPPVMKEQRERRER